MPERCDVVSKKFGKCKNLAYRKDILSKAKNLGGLTFAESTLTK